MMLIANNNLIPTKNCHNNMSIEKSFYFHVKWIRIVLKIFKDDNIVVRKMWRDLQLVKKFELCGKVCDIVTIIANAVANDILSLSS